MKVDFVIDKEGEGMASMEIEMTQVQRKKRIIHATSFLAFILAGACFVYGIRTGIFKSQTAMAAFLDPFGLMAPLVFIAFTAIQSVFMIVPGALGNLVGVLLFGPVWGILCNYLGTAIGSSINFYLARFYGPDIIRIFSSEKGLNKYQKWLEGDERKFHKWFAIAIFLPLAPDDLLCYMAGLTNMTFKKFIIIILLGKPLAVTAYSLLLSCSFTNLLNALGW